MHRIINPQNGPNGLVEAVEAEAKGMMLGLWSRWMLPLFFWLKRYVNNPSQV